MQIETSTLMVSSERRKEQHQQGHQWPSREPEMEATEARVNVSSWWGQLAPDGIRSS